jgi:hypothetical protein
MQIPFIRFAPLFLVLTAVTSTCGGPGEEPRDDAPLPGPAGETVHEYAYLEDEVEHLLAFLRGEAPLRLEVLADSVTLRVAPEGGGDTVAVARDELRSPSAWRVGSYSLLPPEAYGHRTITPGLHWNCRAVGLETLYPELARLPHVGTRLAPGDDAGCLQTWNMTFVFDQDAETPRLTGVVYDQWEW